MLNTCFCGGSVSEAVANVKAIGQDTHFSIIEIKIRYCGMLSTNWTLNHVNVGGWKWYIVRLYKGNQLPTDIPPTVH